MKTPDKGTKFSTGAVRNVGGKGRCDLLPAHAILKISHHIENSLEHHTERNWEKGLPMHTMLDSAIRHLLKYMDGQKDEDHLVAAATNLIMAIETEDKHPEMQDIPLRLRIPVSYGYTKAFDVHPCDPAEIAGDQWGKDMAEKYGKDEEEDTIF